MLDLNELHVFAHLAKAQSFTRAAEQLELPKSTVSRALARLEARLGVRLMERTTRKVMLTEAGELYFDRCQRMLEEAEEAERLMGALHAAPRGRLRVGAPVAFAQYVLGPMLGDFLTRYPQVNLSLHLQHGAPSRGEHGLDVVIQAGHMADSELLRQPLMKLRLGIFASREYLARHGTPATPGDLRQHQCLATVCHDNGEPAESVTWRLHRGSQTEEVRLPARVSVADPSLAARLAESGAGLALLSERAGAGGSLVRVLPEWEPDAVELHAVYASRLQSSPKVRAFVLFVQERLAGGKLPAPPARRPPRTPAPRHRR